MLYIDKEGLNINDFFWITKMKKMNHKIKTNLID